MYGTRLVITFLLFATALPAAAEVRAHIRKNGSIVAEIDGEHLRERGAIVATFDDRYVRQRGAILAQFDGRYVRQRGTIVAEIDGRYIRKSGSIAWEIEPNGNVRRSGSIRYTVDGYTDSVRMKRKVAAYLLFFAE